MYIRGLVVFAIAALLGAPVFAQTAPPPIEAYGNLPSISDAAISPDGRHLALANFANGRSVFRVINIDSGATVRGIGTEPTKLRGVAWADDERALFFASQTFSAGQALPPGVRFPGGARWMEYWRVGVMSLTTGDPRFVSIDENSWAQVGLTRLRAPIEGEPGHALIVAWAPTVGRLSVYNVDLDGGDSRRVASGSAAAIDLVLDQNGRIGASIEADAESNRWRLLAHSQNAPPRQIMDGVSEIGDGPNARGFLRDGRLVIVDRLGADTRNKFYAVSMSDGAVEALVAHDRFDVGGPIADPWTHVIVGAEWVEEFPHQRFFDEDLEAVYQRVRAQFAEGYASLVSWSRDRARYVVFAETNSDAGAYYVYEPEGDRMRVIAHRYPALAGEAALGRRQSITYRSRDGTRIPAYLTLPAGEQATNLPTVLLVHGGPHARDTFQFDWWASFLASRGYAVLQPNFRGSTGYGSEWFEVGRGGWGDGVMQTDVIDGVDALVRSGIADRDRVCIVGASYGGYAALAGATLAPDKFKCAVSVAGVSDLLLMLDQTARSSGGSESAASDWWRLSIGDRRNDRERLRRISPAEQAHAATAPILMLHGEHDTVVPIQQSQRMAERLQQAGREVRFVTMPNDDHWLSNSETRTQMLRETEAFLAVQLAGPRIEIDPNHEIPSRQN
jgi:dipeptidyl aminopeptidase/acylaminoacyl peptidase